MSLTYSAAHGRSVVASDSGENIGEVKSLVIDLSASTIESIHVSGKNKNADLVAWQDIRSFGSDAVMIAGESAATKATTKHDLLAVKGKIDIIGSRIVTTTGHELGKVEDIEFDEATGALLSVSTKTETIRGNLRSLGSYALVVALA